MPDKNYTPSWGGIQLFNAQDNGDSVKSLYESLQKNASKVVRPKTEVTPKHTEKNASTSVKKVYTPIYRNHQLINIGGTNKAEVNEGFNTAHKININKVRRDAELESSKESGSKVLAKQAREAAENNYRQKNHVNSSVQSDRSVDYDSNDPFLKDLETGEYLKDNNGNFISNSQWDAPLGYKALKTVHDINTGTSMVLSMLPSATARSIGNAMFIGQSLADIHHDVKNKDYVSTGLNTAFTFAPYGINKIYKSWKPANRLSGIISDRQAYNILGKRYQTYRDYTEQLQKDIKSIENIHVEDWSKYVDRALARQENPRIDWKATAEKGKQWHANYAENLKQKKDPNVVINLNGQEVTIRPKIDYITGKTNPNVPELNTYMNDLEHILDGNALVGGSTRLYGSGIINGAPHDLELLTTKSRLEAVRKNIGAKNAQYGDSNGFRQQLQGNDKVFNSDGQHLIDVQTIGEDAKGYATGQLAHNYYSRLYPQKYKQLQKQWELLGNKAIQNNKVFITTEQSLPITAEELYTKLQKHPRVYDLMVAMDNYNGHKSKQIGRQAQMFTVPWLTNRIQKMNMSATTDEWKRLKLTPQEIQEARTTWNIPSVYSDDAVESIVNQQLIADNMGVRTVFKRTPTWNTKVENDALSSVVAPFNGQNSGIGGNQLLHSSKGGLGGDVTAILNNRKNINSFRDYINSIKNRLKSSDSNYKLFDDINKKVASGELSIEEGTKQTNELAKKLNINGFYGGMYNKANYFGALQTPTIGLKNYSSGAQSGAANILEIGSNPTFKLDYSSMGFPEIKNIDPHTAPMRWRLKNKFSSFYFPIEDNYVYYTNPLYDDTKAFYKYPEYRKLAHKLKSLSPTPTEFSKIPDYKIATIQNYWDKFKYPVGITSGLVGGLGAAYNNFKAKDNRNNPYHKRQVQQKRGQ